ncbi:hypothetical protein HMI54_004896 [Coelomomyces lativittatus]|nr:hypothetical protein HMI55_004585 [Coelomomyces lativittatus]KAJ1506620.1 hypothetical protein HMI54_004896 [Coelomomyces lativittatus]
MLQIIHKLIKSPEDRTQLKLIFANVSEQDILLKDELDKLAKSFPDRFKVFYIIDKPATKDWKGAIGYITKDFLQKNLPSAKEENVKIFVCGPPPMVKSICGSKAPDYSQGELAGYLKDLGFTSEQVFKF